MLRFVIRIACAVLLVAFMATSAAAQVPDKRTLFTFSGPVAIPGKTLPPGQYLFRLADPMTGGKVIEVRSVDGRIPYGYFFSILAIRPDVAAQPEIRFMETAKGMPPAITSWWYPGTRIGYEFVYPDDQVRRLTQGVETVARVSSPDSGTAGIAEAEPVSGPRR
jgi:hypothetical protein